ncbi:MAG: hypothetical protein KDB01_27210 [Planctomycetaceae bacterium]|nr:hypothetical protein [Planctomycetaceae bacterium]
MRFKYKTIRVLGEEMVGSGRDYVVRQIRYDLNSVQDHEVDVPLSTIFINLDNLGCASALAVVISIPVGIFALLGQYDALPRVPGVFPILVTLGLVFGICTLVVYPIMCLFGTKSHALATVYQQRPNDRFQCVPAEEWESFLQSIRTSTAEATARQARFDAIERQGNT